jgi:hypothetical protein
LKGEIGICIKVLHVAFLFFMTKMIINLECSYTYLDTMGLFVWADGAAI